MKEINNFRDMMLQQVRTIYDADRVIYESLPQLKNITTSEDIKEFIDFERNEKIRQRHRMEIIFKLLKEQPIGEIDDSMIALTNTQKKLVDRCAENELTDATIIFFSRNIVAHQVNGYQSAISCATNSGNPEIAKLLKRALREEMSIQKRLDLLEGIHINVEKPATDGVKTEI